MLNALYNFISQRTIPSQPTTLHLLSLLVTFVLLFAFYFIIFIDFQNYFFSLVFKELNLTFEFIKIYFFTSYHGIL